MTSDAFLTASVVVLSIWFSFVCAVFFDSQQQQQPNYSIQFGAVCMFCFRIFDSIVGILNQHHFSTQREMMEPDTHAYTPSSNLDFDWTKNGHLFFARAFFVQQTFLDTENIINSSIYISFIYICYNCKFIDLQREMCEMCGQNFIRRQKFVLICLFCEFVSISGHASHFSLNQIKWTKFQIFRTEFGFPVEISSPLKANWLLPNRKSIKIPDMCAVWRQF